MASATTLIKAALLGALLSCAPWTVAATVAASASAASAPTYPVQTGVWTHALSSYAEPKYKADFHHFDYVNPDAPKGGVLRLPNSDRRTSFDKFHPFTIKGVAPGAMTYFVFETLAQFSMDEPSAMYGRLAQSMFVEPDLSAITFTLHPLAKFSNGDPVTADDVVHSFKQFKGKLISPTYSPVVDGVTEAKAIDPQTIRFSLSQRNVGKLFELGHLPVFSRKWAPGKALSEIVGEQPIASGPYTIGKAEMPSRLELKRNPDYWARDLPVARGHFNFDRIIYRMYKDPAVRREAFKAGEFDILRELSSSQYARSHQGPKWRDGRIIKQPLTVETGSMLQAHDFNLRRPKFQDIRVREAIMTAWDFESYNRYGRFYRANSLFNNTDFAAEGLPSAPELALLEPFRAELPAAVFGPAFRAPRNDTHPGALRDNLKRAAGLLAESGWNIAADGLLRNAKGEAFTIEYLEPSSIGRDPAFAINLKKLGITYTERLVDFALYRRRLETFDFDMITIVEGKFTLPNAAEIESLYGSKGAKREGSFNYRGIESKAVDHLIELIGAATSLDDLRTAARALDRVVMHSHWQIPQLFTREEATSYWNKFGIPKVKARYFQIDSMPDSHSLPWPLWTWWDKSLSH